MLTIFNDLHTLHQGKVEMFRGELVPCFEVPARADYVLQELERRKLGAIERPDAFDDAAIARVHATRSTPASRRLCAAMAALLRKQ